MSTHIRIGVTSGEPMHRPYPENTTVYWQSRARCGTRIQIIPLTMAAFRERLSRGIPLCSRCWPVDRIERMAGLLGEDIDAPGYEYPSWIMDKWRRRSVSRSPRRARRMRHD